MRNGGHVSSNNIAAPFFGLGVAHQLHDRLSIELEGRYGYFEQGLMDNDFALALKLNYLVRQHRRPHPRLGASTTYAPAERMQTIFQAGLSDEIVDVDALRLALTPLDSLETYERESLSRLARLLEDR
jgi:hypothetical protein